MLSKAKFVWSKITVRIVIVLNIIGKITAQYILTFIPVMTKLNFHQSLLQYLFFIIL